ncbi:MAG: sulfite exporter TauE/SafE family protein, partial [Crocinitomicaceae bacterium]
MTVILAGILLGLTSSLHCIGMCGPIAMAIPIDRTSHGKMLLGIGAYNLG